MAPARSSRTPAAGDPLWEAAIEAVVRVNALPAAERAAAADAWRAQGPTHAAAWAEAERVWRIAGTLPSSMSGTARGTPPRRHRPSRRAALTAGAALAAGTAGLLLAPALVHRVRGDSVTGTAELRDLTASGGHRVVMAPESVARLTAAEEGDRLEVLDGMAFVEARADAVRPLVGLAGALTVSGLPGATFELSRRDGRAAVVVAHGRAHAGAPEASRPESLAAGDWLSCPDGPGGTERGRTAPDRVATWREGILMVDDRPIATAVAELARWYPGRIVVTDDALGRRPVSGVFDLRRPAAALRTMVRPFGGRVRALGSVLMIVDTA